MSLESLSYRGIETLDKIEGTEQGILLGSSISLDFKNTRVAIGHLGNVISQGKVTVSSLINADSNTWQTSKIITEPSASNGSYFGHAVSMNWKGTRIAVGAYGVNKVYVFDATSTSSNPWATYVSNTISGYTDSNFGYSVSLGQDIDTTLAIGAPNHNRVDVWKLSNSSWSLAYSNIGDDIPNIIPLNATSNVTINSKLTSNVSSLQYGFSCKLAPFGTHLIIGAPGSFLNELTTSNSDVPSSDQVPAGEFSWSGSVLGFSQRQSGSARVFVTTDDWVSNVSQLGQTLSGWAADGNYVQNFTNYLSYDKLSFPSFGFSTSMNFDGSVIAIGSPNWTLYNVEDLSRSGNVVVYEYSTVSTLWEQRGSYIRGGGKSTCSGYDVKLDYTGNRLALSMLTSGSFPDVENHLLYVLDWSGTDWVEAQVPISSKDAGYGYSDNEGTKMFSGYRIDMTDGNQVAVSKLWWDDNDLTPDGSGASYVPLFPANNRAYGRVQFYFFLITATFSGNNLFQGYVVANQMMIGSNDASSSNGVAKRLRFGGTFGDNRYDETVIENRVITGSASELLLHKNHQTNEIIDRVRIKASEIHLNHMRMYHSVYQGGQESKDVQTPRFILDQFGTIAIGNLYSGNDSTSTTTSLAETYLDIKAETQIRDKLNVNYPGRTKLLKSRDYTYQGYSPSIINTRCADLIGTNIMYDDQPGAVRVYSITNQGNMPYRESEKAFEFTGTTSGIGQSDLTGVWTDDDASMMFWLKLKSAHSSYSGNVLCSWGETLSTTSGVYRGGCLQLTSTGLTLNFGSGIGTASTTYTFTPDTWYHICVVFPTETTTADGKDYIYINNQNMTLTKTYSTNPYPTWLSPDWDNQGWHFGYGDASGSIPGPAGIYMGMMIFNISWGHGGNQIKEFSYNNGSPSECLCVGGDAHIQNKLGVGTTSPYRKLDVSTTGTYGGMLLRNGDDNQAQNATWPQIQFGWKGTSQYSHFIRTRHNGAATDNGIDFYVCNGTQNNSLTSGVVHGLTVDIDGVGIGTSSPQHKLQVGGNVSLGSSSERLFRPTHYYYQTYSGTSGYAYHFLEINNAWTLNVNGFDKMYIRPDTGVLLDDFTGQHRSFVENVWTENINDYIGLIVCANKNTYTSASFATYKGNRAIQINESLPDVRLSNVAYDKSCFGVISSGEDPESREDTYGTITIPIPKERGDTRTFINSVGEGAIWVTNINGSLESGDYITTSNIVGYGQKQDSKFLANYTVAKITMDCDFNPKIQPVKQIKKELGNVEYWIKYKIKVISQEEYNVLPDTQRRIKTNADGNDKYYQLIYEEKTIEDPLIYEIENYVWIHESREEMINSIDENGIFIWEDHPTETEKAYKIRYLDANGMETDEANHVYKAAFVGCTYHCG